MDHHVLVPRLFDCSHREPILGDVVHYRLCTSLPSYKLSVIFADLLNGAAIGDFGVDVSLFETVPLLLPLLVNRVLDGVGLGVVVDIAAAS